MYLEFIILAIDYFRTLKWSAFIYEWVIPGIIALTSFFVIKKQIALEEVSIVTAFANSSVSLLGVLIGFSITSITILTASSNKSIDDIKSELTEYKINGKKISLYQLLLINFSYVIVVEIFCLMFNLIYPFFLAKPTSGHAFSLTLAFSVNVMFILHVLLVNIRNITDFYFIITTNKVPSPFQKK